MNPTPTPNRLTSATNTVNYIRNYNKTTVLGSEREKLGEEPAFSGEITPTNNKL